MSNISLTRKDLEMFASNDLGFYKLDASRISSIFITQVIQMQTNRIINTHQMLDLVINMVETKRFTARINKIHKKAGWEFTQSVFISHALC
jgi:hypothetical protein